MKNRSLLIVIILFFNCGLIAQTYTLDGNLIITETTEMESDAEINGDLKVNSLSGVTPLFNTNLVFRDDNGKFMKGTFQMWYDAMFPNQNDCVGNFPFWSNSGNPNELHVGSDCTNGVRIGIGTDSPDAELDVNGSGNFAQQVGIGTSFENNIQLLVKAEPSSIGLCVDALGQGDWNYGMKIQSLNNSNFKALAVTEEFASSDNLVVWGDGTIDSKGVEIKSESSSDIVLSVNETGVGDVFRVMGNGQMWVTSINVQLPDAFPDYVFEDDYNLMSLYDLQNYIQENKHLPNMPTADKVAEDGIDLGETDRLLTEKVEELTLYILQLKTELDQLNKKLNQVTLSK